MPSPRRIHDIGIPIHNDMWSYRDEWRNKIHTIASTVNGDNSTVFRFNLCSHTGTYVETSQHKLACNVVLDDFDVTDFVRPCKLISVPDAPPETAISLKHFQRSLSQAGLTITKGDSLIIATGWGMHHRDPEYVEKCPFFGEDLVDWLGNRQLHLLGVDTPVIDCQIAPIGAVRRLFESNRKLLLIAPLVIDLKTISSGQYLLSGAPLNIESVSASLCRPILIDFGSEWTGVGIPQRHGSD